MLHAKNGRRQTGRRKDCDVRRQLQCICRRRQLPGGTRSAVRFTTGTVAVAVRPRHMHILVQNERLLCARVWEGGKEGRREK